MSSYLKAIESNIRALKNPDIATHSQRFFKTGPGEYGEGDLFLGIRVPILRKKAKDYLPISLQDLMILLKSKYHEERLLALLIMVLKYQKAKDFFLKKEIYDAYIKSTQFINNWDLVDSSAHYIVGDYLFQKDRTILYQWVKSPCLWERRISIMSTFYFIKKEDFQETLTLSKILLKDKEDLIHKAVGWMLREIGKRNLEVETSFLNHYYKKMPRTMLRYAIEKFPDNLRFRYLHGKI